MAAAIAGGFFCLLVPLHGCLALGFLWFRKGARAQRGEGRGRGAVGLAVAAAKEVQGRGGSTGGKAL